MFLSYFMKMSQMIKNLREGHINSTVILYAYFFCKKGKGSKLELMVLNK